MKEELVGFACAGVKKRMMRMKQCRSNPKATLKHRGGEVVL